MAGVDFQSKDVSKTIKTTTRTISATSIHIVLTPFVPYMTAMQNLCRSQGVLNLYRKKQYPGVYVAHVACMRCDKARSFGYSINSDRELGMSLIYTQI
jgi:hypothetical protein